MSDEEVHKIILDRLNAIGKKVDDLAEDVAVLKAGHDSGNKSERLGAVAAVISCIIAGLIMFGNVIFWGYNTTSELRDETPDHGMDDVRSCRPPALRMYPLPRSAGRPGKEDERTGSAE